MRTGVDAETGGMLTGWGHCAQSIGKCVTTRYASRVRARHIGSEVPELQDANATADTIFEVYMSIAEALNDPDAGEPGFNLKTLELAHDARAGRFVFLLAGDYFPRGHLGDYSIREAVQTAVPFGGAA